MEFKNPGDRIQYILYKYVSKKRAVRVKAHMIMKDFQVSEKISTNMSV